MKRLFFVLILGLVTAAIGGYFLNNNLSKPTTVVNVQTETLLAGSQLPLPKPLTEFSLIDTNNQLFTQHSLLGQWTLMFFGYAQCPETCPKTLALVNAFWKPLMEKQAHNTSSPRTRFVFVTLDPKSDTVQNLQQFLGHFNSEFIGLTGEESEIQKLSKSCNIYSWQDPNLDAKGQKVIDHTAAFLLINPQGQIQALFTPPHDPSNILKDLEVLIH